MKLILSLTLLVFVPLKAGNLPQLDEKPWVGWYAVSESRKFSFGVKRDGDGALVPMKGRDDAGSVRKWIEFIPVIEEVLPNGRVITKKTLDTGWDAITESTDDAEKISYQGTATGGSRFEVNFEIDGGEVRGGGRVIDKGELTEHPIRFALRVRVQNVYISKDDKETVEKIARRDKITIERVDGKKLKFDALEPVWAEKEECNGPGVRSAVVDLDGFDGSRLELDAGEQGIFEMSNGALRPLYKGFTFGWRSDPAKDPDGKGRFLVEFK